MFIQQMGGRTVDSKPFSNCRWFFISSFLLYVRTTDIGIHISYRFIAQLLTLLFSRNEDLANSNSCYNYVDA